MSVCFKKKLFISNATGDEVVKVCHDVLKSMSLKIMKEESTKEGQTTVFAGEGAVVPLMTKALLSPLGLDSYVQAAQRSGVHIVISPSEKGTHLYACGLALDELTGKLEKYTREELTEEVTDILEAWDFENKFIQKILTRFPKVKEIE
ncbi:MAG: hypothetical protein JSW72_04390 [Candidatus Bathyarchaeota archaeon]|nr:MAG: hypothetical protein JSW72_04390 [Candidatus Bathyarchaeota archaeon]